MRAPIAIWLFMAFALSQAHADGVVAYAGDPSKCFVTVKFEPRESMLHLYPSASPSRGCQITATLVRDALSDAFSNMPADAPPLKLMFLGRLVHYPWLSHGLSEWARSSSYWDTLNGRPENIMVPDEWVVAQLITLMVYERLPADRRWRDEARDGLTFLPELLGSHGYLFVEASAEKAISGPEGSEFLRSDSLNPSILPYDALVHLRIQKVDTP